MYLKNSRYDGTYFTAKKRGLYFFTVNLEIDDTNTEGEFYIMRDGDNQICIARADGGQISQGWK